ncbi:MAG: hypothetical protein ACLQVI_43935 [Polyangiaceae bacterium]|jgi:hypothetical protein
MRRPFLFLTSAFVALAAGDARGDDAPANAASGVTATATSDTQDSTEWFLRRKHTIAELELGFIALPTAPISQGQSGGNVPLVTIGHGDATVSLGFHLLYRGGADWAIGAGALFAPHPTADPTYGGASGLQVTHSRDYLWMGAEGRYIPVHLKTVEAWIGLTAGGVVVADRYDTAAPPVPSDLGTSEVTIRTEGLSIGLQLGGEWAISETVILGLALRFNNWILPASEQCDAIGECSTLTGPVTEIEFGLRVGYRIPL